MGKNLFWRFVDVGVDFIGAITILDSDVLHEGVVEAADVHIVILAKGPSNKLQLLAVVIEEDGGADLSIAMTAVGPFQIANNFSHQYVDGDAASNIVAIGQILEAPAGYTLPRGLLEFYSVGLIVGRHHQSFVFDFYLFGV